jgi:hypothetical protein
VLRALALVSLLASVARAECPESDAGCILEKEGAEAIGAKDWVRARAKFNASLANAPSVRAYLGLATADNALNEPAAAYDAIVDAKRMSDDELADKPGDVDVKARAERIKYLIGDLRAKVGLVYLRLPGNVPPYRVVSVQRKSEGNVPDPFRRPIAVAPDEQALVAVLDDGNKVELDVEVQAGREATYVIPAEKLVYRLQPPPPPLPIPVQPQQPLLRPWAIAIEGMTIQGQFEDGGSGFGLLASGGIRVASRVAVTARLGYITHGDTSTSDAGGNFRTVTSFEIPLFAGGRFYFADNFYLLGEVAYILYDRQLGTTAMLRSEDQLFGVVAAELGVGVHASRFEIELGELTSTGGPPGEDNRLMLTARVRLSP